MRIVVLGAAGMLCSMVVEWLHRDQSLSILGIVRSAAVAQQFAKLYPDIEWQTLDVENCLLKNVVDTTQQAEWVINCIGVIKPHIHEDNSAEIERAIHVNALFPHVLARAAGKQGFQVLQIATDCVYAGTKGKYLEQDGHDALDVYGKTKSLGEVRLSNVHHLRVSIIGPEPRKHVSLLDWFLNHPPGSSVKGFKNHDWNGITTLHFARLCHGLIHQQCTLNHMQHVLPDDVLSKADLLQCCAEAFDREDIQIVPIEAQTTVDRTLATTDPVTNCRLWEAAGYSQPPSIRQMIAELSQFDYEFGNKRTSAPVATFGYKLITRER